MVCRPTSPRAPRRAILGEAFPLRDLPITDVTEIAVFAQDEIAVRDARWTLVPALRVEYYDLSPRPTASTARTIRHSSLSA